MAAKGKRQMNGEPTAFYKKMLAYWVKRIDHEPTAKALADAACSGNGRDYDALKAKVLDGWRVPDAVVQRVD